MALDRQEQGGEVGQEGHPGVAQVGGRVDKSRGAFRGLFTRALGGLGIGGEADPNEPTFLEHLNPRIQRAWEDVLYAKPRGADAVESAQAHLRRLLQEHRAAKKKPS